MHILTCQRAKLAAALIATGMFIACKPATVTAKVDWTSQFQQLILGETQWRTVSKMGNPVSQTTSTAPGIALTTFKWSDGNARHYAVFVLDRLASKTRVTK